MVYRTIAVSAQDQPVNNVSTRTFCCRASTNMRLKMDMASLHCKTEIFESMIKEKFPLNQLILAGILR